MIRYAELVVGQTLTVSPLSYYTAPASTQTAVHAVTVSNPTGAPVAVNLYRVPVGGTPAPSNKIASRTLAAGQTATLHDAINHKLATGSALYADGLGCTLNVSGVEYIPGT